jgi:membrane-associated phospholipid phosphatase
MGGTALGTLGLMITAVLLSAAVVAILAPEARRLHAKAHQRYARSSLAGRISSGTLFLVCGGLATVALVSALVTILTAVAGHELTAFDRAVVAWTADHRVAWNETLVIALTDAGGVVTLAGLLAATAAFAAYRLRSWRPVMVAAVAGGGGALLVAVIKVMIERDRPDPLYRAIAEDGFALPSGHATSAVVVLGTVAWLISMTAGSRKPAATAWIAAVVLAAGIGLSRVYLGVHYPSDVAAGWVLGAAWLITTAIATRLPGLTLPSRHSSDPRPAHSEGRATTIITAGAATGFTAILSAVGLTVLFP